MGLVHSSLTWMFGVVVAVVWGLPQMPHYREGLPYFFDLGGAALVSWYLGLGFLSVGWYGIVVACSDRTLARAKRGKIFWMGCLSVISASLLVMTYGVLMDWTVKV